MLTGFVLPVEEIFFRFIKNREWDVSEMSFGKFIGYASQGNSPFIGIPVFPSRVFRHSAFYVRADRGITSPKDLEGKRVGIPEWAQTAGIYARGFLSETAGVDLRKIKWVQAGMNEAGREEKVEFTLPEGIQYEQRRDTSVSAMLLSGEIDAAISARVPAAFAAGGGKIVRLYPDYRGEEMRYYAETGIFPIMHVIAIRRAVFERYPWVAMNLFKAFEEAKARSARAHSRSDRFAHSDAVGGGDCRRVGQEFRRRSVSLRPRSQPQDARRLLPLRARARRDVEAADAGRSVSEGAARKRKGVTLSADAVSLSPCGRGWSERSEDRVRGRAVRQAPTPTRLVFRYASALATLSHKGRGEVKALRRRINPSRVRRKNRRRC